MIKKLGPAAVLLSIMGVAHAQAAAPAVSVYGLIDMSYGKNETIGDTKANFHSGGDAGSRFGRCGKDQERV